MGKGQLPCGGRGNGEAGEGLFAQVVQFRRALAGMGRNGVGGHQSRRLLFTALKLGLQGVFERIAGQRREVQGLRVVVGRPLEQPLLQRLAGGEPLQAAETSGPIEQQTVAGRRQQGRWTGEHQHAIQFLGVRRGGVAFVDRR